VALHFGALAEQRGTRVLVGSTDGIDTTTPYRGLRSVFEQLLGLDVLLPVPALRRERLEQAMLPHPELARWAPLLDMALGLEPHDNELTARMPEQARAQQTRELLLGILDFEPGPVVLLVEDAHWLDSASLGFLGEALRSRAALLVVATLRPLEHPSKAFEALLEHPGLTRLVVGPLSVEETSALIAARLEVTALPERVAEIVTARSAGNALFSWELTGAMRELGLLAVSGDRCSIAEGVLDLKEALDHALETRGVPPTLQGVITSRLDRMRVEQQLVLKVASTLGQSAPEALLLDVCRLLEPNIDALAALRSLDKHDILELEESAGDTTCTFRHAVIKEAIYGTISFKQRERMHRYAAEWYERAESLGRRRGLLGYHWQRAGEPERAARYFDEAGLEALREYANEEAISLINASLAIDEARPKAELTEEVRRRRAERRLSLGAGHVAWSKYAESREHLEQGLRGLGRWVPQRAFAAALAILVEVLRQVLYRLFPRRFTGRGSMRRELLLREARAFEGLTETYFNLGENTRCLYAALRSLNLAELAGPSAELARAYASVGAIVGFIPWVERARDYCARAKQITRELDDRPAQAWVAVASGVLEAGLMQWSAAAADFEKTYEIGKQLGDGRRCDDSSENVAAIQYLQGDLNQAMETALRLWESAHRRNDLFMQADSLRRQAYCLLAWNRTAEAFDIVQRLTEIRRKEARNKGRELNSDAYLLRALIHARRGELAAARFEAEAGGRILAASSFMFYDVLLEHSTLAEVCLALREAGEMGATQSRAACRRLTGFARTFPCARPAAELWNGVEAWLSGKRPRADEHFSAAIRLAQTGGLVYYQAMALYHSGERLDRKEPTRIERLVFARELLELKHERYYAAKAAAALGVPSES
jgi:predicted ATPase